MRSDHNVNDGFTFYERLLQEISRGADVTLAMVIGREGTECDDGFARVVGAKYAFEGQSIKDKSIPFVSEMAGDLQLELDEVITSAVLSQSPIWRDGTRLVTVPLRGIGINIYMERLNEGPEAIILGGGHVSRALGPLMKTIGFKVVVADDRPDFACAAAFPNADRIIVKPFLEALDEVDLREQSYVVIVTRGHEYDQECLEAVLRKPIAYLGMIGSRKKIEGSFLLAESRGFTKEDLKRVYAPIGIDVRAQTPEEIAICIAAEIIKVRRGGRAASLSDWRRGDDASIPARSEGRSVCPAMEGGAESSQTVSPEIMREFQGNPAHPFAIAIVVDAWGSVPRQPGTKMLVFPDGSIRGTIGGGSGEDLVRREGLNIIESGGSKLVEVDLTGHYLEAFSDGAKADQVSKIAQGVCGGSLKVFVERLEPKA